MYEWMQMEDNEKYCQPIVSIYNVSLNCIPTSGLSNSSPSNSFRLFNFDESVLILAEFSIKNCDIQQYISSLVVLVPREFSEMVRVKIVF